MDRHYVQVPIIFQNVRNKMVVTRWTRPSTYNINISCFSCLQWPPSTTLRTSCSGRIMRTSIHSKLPSKVLAICQIQFYGVFVFDTLPPKFRDKWNFRGKNIFGEKKRQRCFFPGIYQKKAVRE